MYFSDVKATPMTILMEKKAVHQAAAGDVFGAVLFWIVFSHIVFWVGSDLALNCVSS